MIEKGIERMMLEEIRNLIMLVLDIRKIRYLKRNVKKLVIKLVKCDMLIILYIKRKLLLEVSD